MPTFTSRDVVYVRELPLIQLWLIQFFIREKILEDAKVLVKRRTDLLMPRVVLAFDPAPVEDKSVLLDLNQV